jgi:hypothetical protein
MRKIAMALFDLGRVALAGLGRPGYQCAPSTPCPGRASVYPRISLTHSRALQVDHHRYTNANVRGVPYDGIHSAEAEQAVQRQARARWPRPAGADPACPRPPNPSRPRSATWAPNWISLMLPTIGWTFGWNARSTFSSTRPPYRDVGDQVTLRHGREPRRNAGDAAGSRRPHFQSGRY